MGTIRVFGSGFDNNGSLQSGGSDCNWSVSGGGLTGVVSASVIDPESVDGGWVAWNGTGPRFQWIWMNSQGTGTTPAGNPCVFRQGFDLSHCDLNSVSLSISLAGDDSAALRLNGVDLLRTDSAGSGKLVSTTVQGPTNFIAGINTLEVTVPNSGGPGGLAIGVSCTANPLPPSSDPSNLPATVTVPVVVPYPGTSYTLPAINLPAGADTLNGTGVSFLPGAYASTPFTASPTIRNGRLLLTIAALDQPLRYQATGEVVPANASVTVTVTTGARRVSRLVRSDEND